MDKIVHVKPKNHCVRSILVFWWVVLAIWNSYRVFALTFDPSNLYRYARNYLWLGLEDMKRYGQDCVCETEKPLRALNFGVVLFK
jgi:hypothetical protein